jgi:hypothetical protein
MRLPHAWPWETADLLIDCRDVNVIYAIRLCFSMRAQLRNVVDLDINPYGEAVNTLC